EEQQEEEAPHGPARTIAEPPDQNRDGGSRKDEREQEMANHGAGASLAAGVATSFSTRRTFQRSHPAARTAAAPTRNQWCRFITRSLPRSVDPELDQVRVATQVARDHAQRRPRVGGRGGRPCVYTVDLLGRLPAPSQAVLHAADGAIVRTVGVLLDVPRVQRAGIRGWAAGEDDAVTPSGKPLGTLPHVLATGPGLSPQRREATP